MKEVFDYINNNSFLTSTIGVVLGWLLTTVTSVLINNKNNKERKKENLVKEKRRQYENKAELIVENYIEDDQSIPVIDVFLTDFNVQYTKNRKEFVFNYDKDILNKNKHRHKVFYLKNIGKSDINQLDICVTLQQKHMLVNYDYLESIVENKMVNYSCCYDKKILRNGVVRVNLYYFENNRICEIYGTQLAILFKDSFGNQYEQVLFLAENNLYEPRSIDYKEYKMSVTVDMALKCFENPWLW